MRTRAAAILASIVLLPAGLSQAAAPFVTATGGTAMRLCYFAPNPDPRTANRPRVVTRTPPPPSKLSSAS